MAINLALLLTAATPLAAPDAAGYRMEPLLPVEVASADRAKGLERLCTEDRMWCITRDPDKSGVVQVSLPDGTIIRYDPEQADVNYSGGDSRLWPHVIRLDDGVLIGIEGDRTTGFSGGGAQTSNLVLISVRNDRQPQAVLDIPTKGSFMIRACFSEKDMKRRAGACHDEYDFSGKLSVQGEAANGMPVFRYTTRATSFPGRVSRSEDSLAAKPLRKKDLRKVTDMRCTYERTFRFNPGLGRFEPDRPLPDCSDYTEIE